MLHKTRGIILGSFKYRETSVIVRTFTEALGIQSYVVQGVRTQKPRHSMALFQPMSLLDMVVYYKKNAGLQRLAEAQCHAPASHCLGDLKKATVAVFLAELLSKVIREEAPNKPLFDFLWQSVLTLAQQTTDAALFLLALMLQLGHYLGVGISHAQELEMQLQRAGYPAALHPEARRLLDDLLQGTAHAQPRADKATRRNLLQSILQFYQLHLDALQGLKSLKVLQALES